MSEINITVEGGTSKRLLTAGKYCDKDIVVTATGGGGGQESEYFTINCDAFYDTGLPSLIVVNGTECVYGEETKVPAPVSNLAGIGLSSIVVLGSDLMNVIGVNFLVDYGNGSTENWGIVKIGLDDTGMAGYIEGLSHAKAVTITDVVMS